jgi:predicted DNA-binding transcriptional regulator YafY
METDRLGRQLRLLMLLTQKRRMTLDEVGEKLGMSRRSLYRHIDTFRTLGFVVAKEGKQYHISPRSPFFRELVEGMEFSEDEALTLSQVLNSVYTSSPQVRHLREKLASLYDPKVLARHGVDSRVARNISLLFQAIREERVAVLKDYRSPATGTVSDRVVEPYLFLSENSEVRCYEITTGMNKTFKVGRAGSVRLLDIFWDNKERHAPFFADLFHFSGDRRFKVSLVLGALATSVLLEEFPDAESQLTLLDDGRHRLDTEVCSFKGVGRFVMGLSDDIEVAGSPEFREYLRERVRNLTKDFL